MKIEESEAREEEMNEAIRKFEEEIQQLREKLGGLEEKKPEGKSEKKKPPRFIAEEESKSISAINLDKDDGVIINLDILINFRRNQVRRRMLARSMKSL
jgi:hypothetical protein